MTRGRWHSRCRSRHLPSVGGAASLVRVVTEMVCQGTEVGAEYLDSGMNGIIAMNFYGGGKSI